MKIPLILLPGLLSDKEVWKYQYDHLSNIADIIIPNLNHSETPNDMVATVLKNAPANFAIAGHSMGGWIALEVMKHAKNRVVALALINTTALPDSKEKLIKRQEMIAEAEQGNYTKIIDTLLALFIHNIHVTNEVKVMFERNKLAFIPQEKAMMLREDCLAVLNTIICPTLIIHAENDKNFNLDDANLFKNKIKNATLSIVKNCGHMSPMESPEATTALMKKWLQNLTI